MTNALQRATGFAESLGLAIPIMLAPMAGACPPALSVAVSRAGGMGACGAVLMQPDEIRRWVEDFRERGGRALQINVWTPDPKPVRNAAHEKNVRAFVSQWGPEVPESAGDAIPPDFTAQFDAMLALRPDVISSIMGLFSPGDVRRMKAAGVRWFATATTVGEAKMAADAGADAVIAQGAEAGGHRGAFDHAAAENAAVGTFALAPAIADAIDLPVIAAGGVGDKRTVAAALLLGASAVMIGTGFLRCPEASIASAWTNALDNLDPEEAILTRAFSGRAGRAIANAYVKSASDPAAPAPAPYPVQRALTAAMRAEAAATNDFSRMQAWAGQSARLAKAIPADSLVNEIWGGVLDLLH